MKKAFIILSGAVALLTSYGISTPTNAEVTNNSTPSLDTAIEAVKPLNFEIRSFRSLHLRFSDPTKIGGHVQAEIWNEQQTEKILSTEKQMIFKGYDGLFVIPFKEGVFENGETYTFKLFFERKDGQFSELTSSFKAKAYYSL